MLQNKKYLIAVSGGPDSMALMNSYKKQIYGVCHVNYHYRDSSNRDEEIVKRYCKNNNIPFFCLSIDPKIYQNKTIKNFESWARKTRYDFFVTIANKTNIHDILIGHNLNDWLETAIMQENKKVKTFYYGIKQSNNINGLNIFRPFINKTKKELQQYCDQNNIEYGIDETNFDLTYQRNKIRNEISKWSSEKINSKINYFEKLNLQLKEIQKQVLYLNDKWVKSNYSLKLFKTFDLNTQQSLIFMLLTNKGINRVSINKINSIIDFLKAKTQNNKYRIGNNKFIFREKDNLLIK